MSWNLQQECAQSSKVMVHNGVHRTRNNLSGEINERFTRNGSREKPQVIKLDDYHAIIQNILDEFIRLQDEGFILNVPVLLN